MPMASAASAALAALLDKIAAQPSGEFSEVGEDALDVVQRIGALRMASELSDLPRGEVGENRFGERPALGLQPRNLIGDVDLVVMAAEAQLFDLGLELGDGLFEVEKTVFHTSATVWISGAYSNCPAGPGPPARAALFKRGICGGGGSFRGNGPATQHRGHAPSLCDAAAWGVGGL